MWALPAGSIEPADDEPLRLLAHHDTITALAFAPWGDHLVTAALDHMVVWWSAGALDDPAAIDLGSEVLAVAWHPRRPLLAAATRDGDVVVLGPVD